MMRRSALLLLLLLPLALTGCSDGNPSAPAENEAHPEAAWEKTPVKSTQESSPKPSAPAENEAPAGNEGHAVDWLQTHPAEALAAPGFTNCIACHGAELQGSADIPGCYSCHSFNTTPPLTIHPATWTDPYTNHRGYAAANGTTSCSKCHDLGSPAAPSCSSASFDGRSCHASGPGQVPHPLDGTFLNGANHGPVARADLTICQGCHGQPGGPGSNPRFNIGIESRGGTGCEGCHGANLAHPADWGDSKTTSHASAGNIENSCTLCHGVKLDGDGGVGVSCYSCHSFNTTPPLTIHPASWTDPYTNHRGYAATNGTTSCSQCHGSDLHGSPAAPGCFSASFDGRSCHASGPGPVPHPLDGTFLNGANHGPIALADLTICQGCHGQPGGPGSNPRFNIGIESVNGTGCEGCHGVNHAHPADFIYTSSHASAGNIENSCTLCHGVNLDGVGGVGVSCYSCHSFNTTPPLTIHPPSWTDPYTSHRSYATANGTTSCSKCHGSDLHGSPAAPSCFSDSSDGRRCHADGPGHVPHPLDGTFLNGANHGPIAKADLTICQDCHGQPGGPGSNPRFNIGIDSVNGTGCEGCHGTNYAHPVHWAGPNATFHYSAGNIQNSCTLCHGVKLDGVGGVGISCLKCHNSTTTFTLDCTACHKYPPDGTADVAAPLGVAHRNVANVAEHDTCVVCHGMKESSTGGSFAATTNYRLFDKSTNTLGNHWNGQIDMNASPGYDQTNFGCNTALCHANDIGHQLSDSGLPVALGEFGFGSAVPHPLDGTFLDPLNHGPAAKGLTAAFPNGMADCQPCHAQAGTNPRFNVGINRVGGNGCESCHNDGTAHPSVGGRETVHWYDGIYKHSDVTGFTACTLCHGSDLGGGTGPACTDCHVVDPVVYRSGCVSCHNLPPDGGAPAGNQRPNRQGQHTLLGHTITISAIAEQTCSRCHNGAGVGTPAHFDTSSPADVNFLHPDPSDTMTAVSTGTNTTCNGACHIKNDTLDFISPHINRTWYP